VRLPQAQGIVVAGVGEVEDRRAGNPLQLVAGARL
jgi:hypothetical protein